MVIGGGSGVAAERRFTIPTEFDHAATISGTKSPVLVGPSEVRWSTRTPDGLGTVALVTQGAEVTATAWGPGSQWLLDQAPNLYGVNDSLDGWDPTGNIGKYWRQHPFRLGRTDRPWDALIGAVLGQKVQTVEARKSRRKLARQFGEPAPGPFEGWVLPSAETVAQMSYYQFHPLGIERKRATALITAANELRRIGDFSALDPADADRRLQAIRGIGPWTAALVTSVTFGYADAVPTGDFHIPNQAAWWLAGEPRGTDERMLKLLEPYAGHRWRAIRIVKSLGPAPRYGPRLALGADGLARGR